MLMAVPSKDRAESSPLNLHETKESMKR
jgi:hypothetical protein